MNHVRRILTTLIAIVGALVAFAATSPAAFAIRMPPPAGPGRRSPECRQSSSAARQAGRSPSSRPRPPWLLPFWPCYSTAPGWRARCMPLRPEPTAMPGRAAIPAIIRWRPGHRHPGSINVWVPEPTAAPAQKPGTSNGQATFTIRRSGSGMRAYQCTEQPVGTMLSSCRRRKQPVLDSGDLRVMNYEASREISARVTGKSFHSWTPCMSGKS